MSNRKFYQETFSQVHGKAEIRWEDYQKMKSKKHMKRLTMLAAAVALAAVLSGIAFAAHLFGLREAVLPERQSVNVVDENSAVAPGVVELKDFVSLSGYNDTPESKAQAEWMAFTASYDRDGAILNQIGNGPTGLEEKYDMYLAYTQEMADALDAIVDKYGLHLHTRLEVVLPEVLSETVGPFARENVTPYSGYIYEDGTFQFDGDAEINGYGTLEYQFRRSVYGGFNIVALNAGNISDFQEWSHTTPDGTTVTLGLGKHSRSIILTDLGDCFVLLNVLAGKEQDEIFSSGPIGRNELEALADSFDFSALSPVREPDFDAILEANERYMNALETEPPGYEPEGPEDEIYTHSGIQKDVAWNYVAILAQRLEDDKREEIADMIAYPVNIETADGESVTANTPDELLEYYDATIGQNRLGLAQDLAWDPEPRPAVDGLVLAADGIVMFGQIEESVIRIFLIRTDQWSIRAASGIE